MEYQHFEDITACVAMPPPDVNFYVFVSPCSGVIPLLLRYARGSLIGFVGEGNLARTPST